MNAHAPIYTDAQLRRVRTFADAVELVTVTYGVVTTTIKRPVPDRIRRRPITRRNRTEQ